MVLILAAFDRCLFGYNALRDFVCMRCLCGRFVSDLGLVGLIVVFAAGFCIVFGVECFVSLSFGLLWC